MNTEQKLQVGGLMADLLPCPFCGGEATAGPTATMYIVECNNAGCPTNPDAIAVFKHTAIAAWNHRAPVQAQGVPFAHFVQPSGFGPFIECEPGQAGSFAAYRTAQGVALAGAVTVYVFEDAMSDPIVEECTLPPGRHVIPVALAQAPQQPADADLYAAVARLIKCKGRHHTEQNYAALVLAFDAATPAQQGDAGDIAGAKP